MGLMEEVKRAYSIEEIARRLGLSIQHKGGKVLCHCPFHEDAHPSLELNVSGKYQGRYICRACPKNPGEGDIIDLVRRVLKLDDDVKAALWIKGEDKRAPIEPPKPRSNHQAPAINEDLTALAFQAHLQLSQRAKFFLMRRGLATVIDDFHLGSTDASDFPKIVLPDYWHEESGRTWKDKRFLNRIIIPYIGPGRQIEYVNARAMQPDVKPKYLKAQMPHKSQTVPPYLLDALIAEGVDDLFICEGEVDALSVYAARPDLYACAIPGVNGLTDQHLMKFAGVRVWIIMDNDAAGMQARKDLERRLRPVARSLHHVFVEKDYSDLNEMLVKRGAKYLAGYLEACIRKAVKKSVFRPF